MQLSFDTDGSLPEVAAACAVAGDESGQNRDLAPRADVAESNETAENQACVPLTGAFDAKRTFQPPPSPVGRGVTYAGRCFRCQAWGEQRLPKSIVKSPPIRLLLKAAT
jgi:hypothetical protein